VGGAIDVMIGRTPPPAGAIAAVAVSSSGGTFPFAVPPSGGLPGESAPNQALPTGQPYRLVKLLLGYSAEGEQAPAVLLSPKSAGKHAVVWIDPLGKQGLFDNQGKLKPAVSKLLSSGRTVLGVDLFGQGEFTADGRPIAKTRLVNPAYAGYTFGYNPPLFAQRVHDILSAISWLRHGPLHAERVDLAGLHGAGAWVAAARAQAGTMVQRAALDTAGFRFANVAAIDEPNFLPGGAKYLDLPGILALSAPQAIWIAGEGAGAPIVQAAYAAAGCPDRLTLADVSGPAAESAAVDWLLQ
jgi:hypothetical protein